MSFLREKLKKEELKKTQTVIGVNNVLALPRLEKVVVNAGLARAVVQATSPDEVLKRSAGELALITAQKPVITTAKKSIASFKTRQGMPLGLKVTLRGARMYDFLERLIHIVLPRVRDFRGLDPNGLDGQGNLNIGLKEHTVFPEASADAAHTFGLEITVVLRGGNRDHKLVFLKALGFPFKGLVPH